MYTLIITLTGLLDVAGAVILRYWSADRKPTLLLLGIAVYGLMGFVFAQSLQYRGVAISNILWIALSTILVTGAGLWLFGEKIGWGQIAGIVLVTAGVILIQRGN